MVTVQRERVETTSGPYLQTVCGLTPLNVLVAQGPIRLEQAISKTLLEIMVLTQRATQGGKWDPVDRPGALKPC